MSEWLRVNKAEPCKVCQHGDWCCVTSDGTLANCMRIESDRLCKNGGWLHKLDGDYKPVKPRPFRRTQSVVPKKNFYRLSLQYSKNLNDRVCGLADKLGISSESLQRLGAGWDGKNYTFPMYDGHDRVIGIRLRTKTGRRFSVPGSKNGLFWPAGVRSEAKTMLFFCEGQSDCAALLDMGFDSIGRPSCSGGVEHIKAMLFGNNREVVIMADRDAPKTAPDGRKFNPGLDGADRLGQAIKPLCRSVRVIKPCVGKDIREWYNDGATAAAVLAVVKNTRFL